jgi:LAO/AO transport system kinase
MLRHVSPNWQPPVLTLSATKKEGIDIFWKTIENFRDTLSASGEFAARRRHQAVDWLWQLIDAGLRQRFRAHPEVNARLDRLVTAVASGDMTPTAAARELLACAN